MSESYSIPHPPLFDNIPLNFFLKPQVNFFSIYLLCMWHLVEIGYSCPTKVEDGCTVKISNSEWKIDEHGLQN